MCKQHIFWEKKRKKTLILGGDNNCIQDVKMDRISSTNIGVNADIGFAKLNDLKITLCKEDNWRRKYPTKKSFTRFVETTLNPE